MATPKVLLPGDPGYDPNEGDPWAGTPFAKQPEYGLPGDSTAPKSTSQALDPKVPDNPTDSTPPPATPAPTTPATDTGAANNPTDPYAPANQQQGHLTGDQQAQAMLARLNAPGQTMSAADMVNEFNNAYGAISKYYNDSRGETIGFPTGYLAKGADGKWTWTVRGPETGGGNGAPGASSNYPSPDYSNLDAMLQKMLQQQEADRASGQAYKDKIHGSILDTIGANSKPVNADDPIITTQMAAYRGEQGRNTQLMREALAERNSATGGTSGAMESGIKSTIEDAGNKTASAEASAMATELGQRRAALQGALSTGAGVLTADEDRNLRTTLAGIDAQLSKLQLQQTGNLTSSQQALSYLLGDRSLTNQNNQFYDQFGANQANQQSELDQLLLEYLLGR